MLKKIGTYAREDLEAFFNTHVNVDLWVKVKENWRDNANYVRSFGYKEWASAYRRAAVREY